MRRFIFSLSISGMLILLFHFAPVWTDSFTVVRLGSEYRKVFHCGWPIRYARPGDFEQGLTPVKVLFNFITIASGVYITSAALNTWRRQQQHE